MQYREGSRRSPGHMRATLAASKHVLANNIMGCEATMAIAGVVAGSIKDAYT